MRYFSRYLGTYIHTDRNTYIKKVSFYNIEAKIKILKLIRKKIFLLQEKKDRSKVMTFLKKFSRRRSKRKNSVQEIHINPEVDEERWASRSVNEGSSGNTSRTSSGDGTGNKRAGNSAIGNSVLETNSCEDVNEMKELNPYQPNFTS